MRKIKLLVTILTMVTSMSHSLLTAKPIWQDNTKSIEERTDDLLSKLTIEEKVRFFGSTIPGISRLGIEPYEWYAEALHGLIGIGCTSFPQNNAMGATWNKELMFDVASAISDEVRATTNYEKTEAMIFSPTVNMSRDPRWGRNEECYSEDPYHMSEMAKMYVRGMQGTDPNYLKTVCTVKHYVANNVDQNRTRIHSYIEERDLRDYYFPAYKACVVEERAAGIMTALNGLNGVPCSAHDWLINGVLRDEWGFEGYVIADWGAVGGVHTNMNFAEDNTEAAAKALLAGCDQECIRPDVSFMVKGVLDAYEKGLVTEADIDSAARRLIRLRFMVGGFGLDDNDPYINVPKSARASMENNALALKAAQQSIVLLKNKNNTLPLGDEIKKIAVVGPFADRCWLGIYSGVPTMSTTPLQGIEERFDGDVLYAKGCSVNNVNDDIDMNEAISAAQNTDVVIAFVGNDDTTSTEGNDRESLSLPGKQEQLLDELCKVNKNVVVVLIPSGSTTIGSAQQSANGIICSWANGQQQGKAIADVLFGDVNPSGKLNTTWFANDNDLPDLHDYNVRNNRTYMYFEGKPLYPYGYGLSYTSYEYSNLSLSSKKVGFGESVEVSFDVTNSGKQDGDEIAQLYIRDNAWSEYEAAKSLKGFDRISLKSGETKRVTIVVDYDAFSHWAGEGDKFEVSDGKFEILVGDSSENILLSETIKVSGGILPEHSLRTQSYDEYNSDPRYRQKEYEKIVSSENPIKRIDNSRWMEYDIVFTDPGYYVSEWNLELDYSAVIEGRRTKVSIGINDIILSSYFIHESVENGKIMMSIPKPDYSIPQKVRLLLPGNVDIHSLSVIDPKDKSVTTFDKPDRSNKL